MPKYTGSDYFGSDYFAALRGVAAGAEGDIAALIGGTSGLAGDLAATGAMSATLSGTSALTSSTETVAEVTPRPVVMPTPLALSQGGRMAGQVRRVDLAATLAGTSSVRATLTALAPAAARLERASGALHGQPTAIAHLAAGVQGGAHLEGRPTFLDEVEEIVWLLAA